MESKLWCFGDSYTQGYNPNVDWCKEYINFKGYQPKVYCDFLGEKLGIKIETIVVEDNHYSENAHKKLSLIFSELLKNKLI